MPNPLPKLRTLLRNIISLPATRAFILSLTIYLLTFTYCRFRYWRDPHSAFFNSDHVYDLGYSKFRESQAQSFIHADTAVRKAGPKPEICAAFVTVKRENTQYVDAAIGSLLEGLTDREREDLYLHVLFANIDPSIHPMWQQPWFENAVDSAMGYNVSADVLAHLQELEMQRNFHEKGVFDYLYVLDFCYELGTPYIAVFEDDIIVADGWLAKTLHALRGITRDAVGEGSEYWNWIYLRLFYTETSMQWQNTDFWYHHLHLTIALAGLAGFVLLVGIRYQWPTTRRHLDGLSLAVICLITIPAFTVLVFMIGKYSLLPPNGVFKMNKYGCCTQALVFPREQIPALAGYLKERGSGQTDSMIEDYADKEGKQRLALGPQLVQHVGLQSSRDNTFVNSQSTWAFWFEENDPGRLRREHDVLVNQ